MTGSESFYPRSSSVKTCSICKTLKPLDQFNRKAGRKDGLQGKCRECSRRMSKAHYDANPAYYRAKNKVGKKAVQAAIAKLEAERLPRLRRRVPPGGHGL